jgi:hypothetical protein
MAKLGTATGSSLEDQSEMEQVTEPSRSRRLRRLGGGGLAVAVLVLAMGTPLSILWSAMGPTLEPGAKELQARASPSLQPSPTVNFTPGCRHYGPWTHCFQAAQWIQQVVDEAGYQITSDTLSAFGVEGGGLTFSIHATDAIAAGQLSAESYQPFGTVDGTVVYSDGTRITWRVQGLSIWVSGYLFDEPTLDTIAPLLRASDEVPYEPEVDG